MDNLQVKKVQVKLTFQLVITKIQIEISSVERLRKGEGVVKGVWNINIWFVEFVCVNSLMKPSSARFYSRMYSKKTMT